MYHFSGMPLKLTMAPSICKPRLTLAIAFADSTDGLTDATSNSGGAVGAWLKTARQLREVRRTHRIVCILLWYDPALGKDPRIVYMPTWDRRFRLSTCGSDQSHARQGV